MQETFIHYNKDCDENMSGVVNVKYYTQETFIHYNKDCDQFNGLYSYKYFMQETFIHYNKDCDVENATIDVQAEITQETFIHYNKDCDSITFNRFITTKIMSRKPLSIIIRIATKLATVMSQLFPFLQETFIHYNKDCDSIMIQKIQVQNLLVGNLYPL